MRKFLLNQQSPRFLQHSEEFSTRSCPSSPFMVINGHGGVCRTNVFVQGSWTGRDGVTCRQFALVLPFKVLRGGTLGVSGPEIGRHYIASLAC